MDSYPPDLSDDTFSRATRVHDWRTYVPDSIRDRWKVLTRTERLLVYEMGEDQADREEWE